MTPTSAGGEQQNYIRCEMTPTSVGGEQQISISGGSQSPIDIAPEDCRDAQEVCHALHDAHLAARMQRHSEQWWDFMADIMETNSDNSPVCVDLRPVFHLD